VFEAKGHLMTLTEWGNVAKNRKGWGIQWEKQKIPERKNGEGRGEKTRISGPNEAQRYKPQKR